MGKALLFPGWDPERPHYDQIVGEEDELDFAEAFHELADGSVEPAPEGLRADAAGEDGA